ncbi:MAG: NYN domain-containing protein [Candidatus Hydrogenedentes bacterium]|nr:NYN domain-containing protein [Candidatus Hydrogenedentota bacterium]
MNTHYVLIDFENVQPKHVDRLKDGEFRVLVFVGPQQTKIPIEMASALQSLGSGVEYVKLEKAGKNALDFHIAYYLGVLSHHDPEAHFHVISKDTGFDPLIDHLRRKKVLVKRCAGIAEITIRRPSHAPAGNAQLERVIKDLSRRTTSKPRTLKTLRSTILAHFRKELAEQELDDLIDALEKRGFVAIEGNKVTYDLPESR